MKYLFDEEIQETKPVGIGYWILFWIIAIVCLAFGVFAAITWIKTAILVWGWQNVGKLIDLTKRRFDRLVVVRQVETLKSLKSKSATWECLCDCGNITRVNSQSLRRGDTKSCGCLNAENNRKTAINNIKNNAMEFYDGTMIRRIRNADRLSKANKTGITGVSFDKQRKKWRVNIMFKGVPYRLGDYCNKKDAIVARKKAEEQIFKGFLEWYDENIKEKDVEKKESI
jgi:hypothetical protein